MRPYNPNEPWTLDTARLQMPAYNPVNAGADATLGAGISTLNPPLAAAGLGLKAIGTGMSIYGAHQAQETADENAAFAKDAWLSERLRQLLNEREHADEETLLRAYALGEGAQADRARGIASMTAYNRAIGR